MLSRASLVEARLQLAYSGGRREDENREQRNVALCVRHCRLRDQWRVILYQDTRCDLPHAPAFECLPEKRPFFRAIFDVAYLLFWFMLPVKGCQSSSLQACRCAT